MSNMHSESHYGDLCTHPMVWTRARTQCKLFLGYNPRPPPGQSINRSIILTPFTRS